MNIKNLILSIALFLVVIIVGAYLLIYHVLITVCVILGGLILYLVWMFTYHTIMHVYHHLNEVKRACPFCDRIVKPRIVWSEGVFHSYCDYCRFVCFDKIRKEKRW